MVTLINEDSITSAAPVGKMDRLRSRLRAVNARIAPPAKQLVSILKNPRIVWEPPVTWLVKKGAKLLGGKLCSANCMIVPKGLALVNREEAEEFGLNEAFFLEEIRSWMRWNKDNNKLNHYRKGRWWMYNNAHQWRSNHFPWLSISTIRRTLKRLEELGLVMSEPISDGDGRRWWTVVDDSFLGLPDRVGNPVFQNDMPLNEQQDTLFQNDVPCSAVQKAVFQNEKPDLANEKEGSQFEKPQFQIDTPLDQNEKPYIQNDLESGIKTPQELEHGRVLEQHQAPTRSSYSETPENKKPQNGGGGGGNTQSSTLGKISSKNQKTRKARTPAYQLAGYASDAEAEAALKALEQNPDHAEFERQKALDEKILKDFKRFYERKRKRLQREGKIDSNGRVTTPPPSSALPPAPQFLRELWTGKTTYAIQKLVQKYGEDRLRFLVEWARKDRDIHHLAGYTLWWLDMNGNDEAAWIGLGANKPVGQQPRTFAEEPHLLENLRAPSEDELWAWAATDEFFSEFLLLGIRDGVWVVEAGENVYLGDEGTPGGWAFALREKLQETPNVVVKDVIVRQRGGDPAAMAR